MNQGVCHSLEFELLRLARYDGTEHSRISLLANASNLTSLIHFCIAQFLSVHLRGYAYVTFWVINSYLARRSLPFRYRIRCGPSFKEESHSLEHYSSFLISHIYHNNHAKTGTAPTTKPAGWTAAAAPVNWDGFALVVVTVVTLPVVTAVVTTTTEVEVTVAETWGAEVLVTGTSADVEEAAELVVTELDAELFPVPGTGKVPLGPYTMPFLEQAASPDVVDV
jgi:hypothetical protein